MLGGIMGACCGISYSYSQYHRGSLQLAAAERGGQNTHQVQRGGGVWSARRAASPETPVQPVHPAAAVDAGAASPAGLGLPIRQGADPVEMAVRMRIRPYEENKGAPAMAGLENGEGPEEAVGAESAQKALEEGECQTCKERKYQDGSEDMGVSFQTPTNIAPEQAASAVRGHENEHVVRERAKADREDRRVVSQSVTLHTDICPECGKAYVSGGTTRTVTAAERENPYTRQEQEETRTPFSVMA
nr:hypothetical protein [uncultured Oscillibacter sp.]